MKLKSFQSRILLYFIGLIAAVFVLAFFVFDAAIVSRTRARIGEELTGDAVAFRSILDERARQLTMAGQTLSGDFAFKSLYANSRNDFESLYWAVENFLYRIDASVIIIVSTDNKVAANTLIEKKPEGDFEFPELIEKTKENGTANGVVYMNGQAFQLVVVPLKAPRPIAWICLGFALDDDTAAEFKRFTQAEISFARSTPEVGYESLASTVEPEMLSTLIGGINKEVWEAGSARPVALAGDEYEVNVVPLGEEVSVVLSRSLDEELAPFVKPLRNVLTLLFSAGLLVAGLVSIWISRSVTKPVRTLVEGVRKIGMGDYSVSVTVRQEDELGELADSFNEMAQGLAERDKVSDLLGKVVSPEIAKELIGSKLELGGEERVATILFSDIRNFTTISEKLRPGEVLDMLNDYLSRMSDIVDRNGGVVDKYVGDAVMAIFGVPLDRDSHADNALTAALEMMDELDRMNEEFKAAGREPLQIGIGINTAEVIAGNIGSKSRFNYTVIGDGVNVASRLESLTKDKSYNATIIVSSKTIENASGKYNTRYLDSTTVKGKQQAVEIYALDGNSESP